MSYFDDLSCKYNKIKAQLMDEESVRLFDARVEYAITGNLERAEEVFFDTSKQWNCGELDTFLQKFSKKKDIVLFGAGKVGRKTKHYLEASGYFPICFCDNGNFSNKVDDIPVVSVDQFIEKYKNAIIIICSLLYGKEMYHQLLEKGYPAENILFPGGNRIQIHCGKQYFDLFHPKSEEVFIDAGGFEGSTVVDFFSWFGKTEGAKCYSLEPVPEMFKKIKERSEQEKWKNVMVCNWAAWDKDETIYLTKDQKENGIIWGGSYVGESETGIKISGKPIDIICSNEKNITYIKMDIEGAELKALKGAKNTIMQHKPKLAISIYYKPWDVFEIPDYILSLVPEYKMYIRHYAADFTETVLYAEI